VPVSFTVRNVNRSRLPCATDGARYAIGLDGSAPRFRAAVGRWVDRHGFSARGR